MATPVTDPDLLAQLNGGPKPVTDPDLLKQLDGPAEAAPMSWSDTAKEAWQNATAENAYNTFIDPLVHPVRTAEGIYSTVAGMGQKLQGKYETALGLPNRPQPDAPAADALGEHLAQYGSAEGIKRAVASNPFGVLADVGSVAAPLVGRAGGLSRAAAAIPETEELFDAANGAYSRMRNYGIEIHPQAAADVATNIRTELEAEGYAPDIAPKTYSAVGRLENPVGANATISDIDIARKRLNRAKADYSESDAARRAIGHIDNFVANLDPNDVVVNPHFADDVANAAREARGNYAAGSRSEILDDALDRAERRTGSTGSGQNFNNVLRQEVNRIVNSRALSRGFNADEMQLMRDIIGGSGGANIARGAGKMLAPNGPISAATDIILGHATGIPPEAFMGAGFAAKKLGDMSSLAKFNRLRKAVRSRSPLAQSRPSPLPKSPDRRAAIAGATLQAARLSNQGQP